MIKSNQELIDKNYITKRYYTLNDPEFISVMAEAPWHDFAYRLKDEVEIVSEYKEKFLNRLKSTKINKVTGLERFKCQDIIHGVTQSFDEIFYRHHKRRLRIFRGEYTYHRRSFSNWEFIDTREDDFIPLDQNDYVIFSLPFAGNGHYPPNLEDILDECLKKKVPVMVDCAWFGTCFDMDLDFNHPAITEVSFSLSKGLGVGKVRSGVRYSNFEHDEFPIRHQNNSIYLPIMALQVGMYMMEKIPVDKIPNRYKDLHKKFCQTINIQNSSKCIHIATPSRNDHRWQGFQVGNKYYKLGIKEALKTIYIGKINPIQ